MDFRRISNIDQVASVRQSLVCGPSGTTWRAIDVNSFDGLSLRILPDRGFDIASASWRGNPLSWIGHAGEGPLSAELDGHHWEAVFTGGLLTTCGLANVGEPSEGHGQHGRINHLPAEAIAVTRQVIGNDVEIVLAATIFEETIDGGCFRLDRQYRLLSGAGVLQVVDKVTNQSAMLLPAPFLYHINLGWPIIDDATHIEIADRVDTITEFGDQRDLPTGWQKPGTLSATGKPSVTVEHLLESGQPEGCVKVCSPNAALMMMIKWDRTTLPRLFQWINCQPGEGVVAIEPSNACTEGRHVDRRKGLLSHLAAGECRRTSLEIRVGAL